jgi:hypothetical protein
MKTKTYNVDLTDDHTNVKVIINYHPTINVDIIKKEIKLDTYSVYNKLVRANTPYRINVHGEILPYSVNTKSEITNMTNCFTMKQAVSLKCINHLRNVAKYLNGNWEPDVDKMCYVFALNALDDVVIVSQNVSFLTTEVAFKSEQLAETALKLIGKESIIAAIKWW